jgi:hypothetical protein
MISVIEVLLTNVFTSNIVTALFIIDRFSIIK